MPSSNYVDVLVSHLASSPSAFHRHLTLSPLQHELGLKKETILLAFFATEVAGIEREEEAQREYERLQLLYARLAASDDKENDAASTKPMIFRLSPRMAVADPKERETLRKECRKISDAERMQDDEAALQIGNKLAEEEEAETERAKRKKLKRKSKKKKGKKRVSEPLRAEEEPAHEPCKDDVSVENANEVARGDEHAHSADGVEETSSGTNTELHRSYLQAASLAERKPILEVAEGKPAHEPLKDGVENANRLNEVARGDEHADSENGVEETKQEDSSRTDTELHRSYLQAASLPERTPERTPMQSGPLSPSLPEAEQVKHLHSTLHKERQKHAETIQRVQLKAYIAETSASAANERAEKAEKLLKDSLGRLADLGELREGDPLVERVVGVLGEDFLKRR